MAGCYVLEGTGDPREKFAEMYSSGPEEAAHPLDDVSDAGLVSPIASLRRCAGTSFALGSSNPLMRFASTGWRKLKGTLGGLFGVNTAYAIDLGLGGLTRGFSNIGPALPADIQRFSDAVVFLPSGVATTISRVQIVGSHSHGGEGAHPQSGINGVWVTFTVEQGNGTLRRVGGTGGGAANVTVTTSHLTISNQEIDEDGIASVSWTPPPEMVLTQ